MKYLYHLTAIMVVLSSLSLAALAQSTSISELYDAQMTVVANEGTKSSRIVAVDLGLPSGLKWANCNIGASSPEEYGDYFAWGETGPYYSSQNPLTWKSGKSAGYVLASYRWCNGHFDGLTKYNTDGNYGPVVDNKTVLELADDAARANCGGSWRMPTREEFQELLNNCTTEWTTLNGVDGRMITSKNNGNSIFLPAAGDWDGTSLSNAGSNGRYWSSSLDTDGPYCALILYFDSGYVCTSYGARCGGFSVRPVTE